MLIDLQVHSTYSDGYLTPTQMAAFLARQGVKVAALTDHNTVGGVDEFQTACLKHNIKPIVGIELYTKLRHTNINVLWFNFDHNNPELHKMLRDSQTRRRSKVRKILERMSTDGFKIDTNKLLDKYNHYVSINHLIDDILRVPENKKKIMKELDTDKPREEEIIYKYFNNPQLPKLENSSINILRILKLKKKIGGQVIFNHPGKYNQLRRSILTELKSLGVDGLEVLSPHHSIGAVMYAQFMARELGFIMTGGSDFHRFEGNKSPLNASWDYFQIDSKFLKGVGKIIN
ncbi:MAG: hypothetical protein UT48_C0001G0054 [Parcubacteria group bacterium GW2011_GWE2_39_37]|uniref:Polymerase/histidinol phosphatase N-terminal domain-containing protein n=1 Tax=Candidatus Falkowbacteria bacterium GW2011_GWF2_39_8 TaxID=1618642 RepID=A0A0G0SGF9_9BACT|nr:MAG: hypothetical protein UT48_C0001G0054 [Parcubacteria group bacterium GW2011_GWE2_39_37]KKR33795.1 MAG: hypothetical protein UT64_C0003G0016 [Candidatus Falkowbacteria bacterium GW2011_GWF2_39_8]